MKLVKICKLTRSMSCVNHTLHGSESTASVPSRPPFHRSNRPCWGSRSPSLGFLDLFPEGWKFWIRTSYDKEKRKRSLVFTTKLTSDACWKQCMNLRTAICDMQQLTFQTPGWAYLVWSLLDRHISSFQGTQWHKGQPARVKKTKSIWIKYHSW